MSEKKNSKPVEQVEQPKENSKEKDVKIESKIEKIEIEEKKKNDVKSESETSKVKNLPNFKVVYKSFSLEECELQITNELIIIDSINQNRTVQVVNFKEVCGIHTISSKTDEERVTLQISQKIGVIIYIVKLDENVEKKFQKYFLFVENVKIEKEIAIVLEQMAFIGEIDYAKINEIGFLKKEHRRMLLIVNPKAGKKKAKNIAKTIIQPILDIAPLKYDIIFTQRRGHATEIVRNFDFRKYNEIGCVGGDGTVMEITNGIMNHKKVSFQEASKVPISVFPAGTGNVFQFEMGTQINNEIASLICARGKYTSMHIATVFHNNQRRFATLLLCFGLFSNSAFMLPRFLGELAYTFGAVFSILRLKKYDFKIKLIQDDLENEELRETPFNPPKAPPKKFWNVWREKTKIDVFKSSPKFPDTPLVRKYFSSELKRISQRLAGEVKNNSKNEVKSDLKTKVVEIDLEDIIVCSFGGARKVSSSFWGTSYNGINSAKWDLLIGKPTPEIAEKGTRKHFLGLMKKMQEKEPVNHMTDKFWTGHRCRGFYCEPQRSKKTKYLDLDGEKYPNTPCAVEVHPNILKFMHL